MPALIETGGVRRSSSRTAAAGPTPSSGEGPPQCVSLSCVCCPTAAQPIASRCRRGDAVPLGRQSLGSATDIRAYERGMPRHERGEPFVEWRARQDEPTFVSWPICGHAVRDERRAYGGKMPRRGNDGLRACGSVRSSRPIAPHRRRGKSIDESRHAERLESLDPCFVARVSRIHVRAVVESQRFS
jgi:hypothetical protein